MTKKALLLVVFMVMASVGHRACASRTGMFIRIHADTLISTGQTGGCTSVSTNLVFTESCQPVGQCACGGIIAAYAEAKITSPCMYKWTLKADPIFGIRGGYVEAQSSAVSGAQDGYQTYYYFEEEYCSGNLLFGDEFTFSCIGPGSGGE